MGRVNTLVETAYGPVRGSRRRTVNLWKGVRYAAPPMGDLRWRAPSPRSRGPKSPTLRAGPVCPQPVEPRIPIDLGAPQGDDCLTLNVWASSDTAAGDGKPVMVWVHGGAYILGSASQPLYNGAGAGRGRRRGRRHRQLPVRRFRISGSVVVRHIRTPVRHQSRPARRDPGAAVGARQHRRIRRRPRPRDTVRRIGGRRHRHHPADHPGRRRTVQRRDRAELTGHVGI